MTENDNKNQRLGMGLNALFGMQKINQEDSNKSSNQNQSGAIEILINKIIPNINQPRKSFDTQEMMNLAESIKENGILQPILVQKIDEDKYEIITGERRFRAAKLLNLEFVPVIIKDFIKEKGFIASIIENIQRSDLTLIEEANAYLQLQSEFNLTQNEISHKVGKHRSHIANMLRIANLSDEIKNFIIEHDISIGIAKILAGRQDVLELLKLCIKKSLTVRQLEEYIKTLNNKQSNKTKNFSHSMNQEFLSKLKLIEDDFESKFNIKIRFIPKNENNSSNKDVCISFNNEEKLETLLRVLFNNNE